ncbi:MULTISPECIES: heavy-metal-associated domain-containing protein [Noviherbaspirillum]|jgi:copper chaperone|uniref:Heavy-metal-associated domain-containing protein n=1 Tax=Noviherbaspirillum album TaxID=3080276 RepID=A0ABU6JGU2_9BURK|nr:MULTISPECIES: heavy-metal-associated domain-containing protein [Noviherbaspirillum]MEC4722881.1 heavy-metal-associated domain-containing protein [Noviherbaspirillum sp. CPCC 100848]
MYELQVEGMTCGGCANSVTRSVRAVDSNAKVDVDLKAKKVRIDTSVPLEKVSSAIADAGYPVVASATL